VEVEGVAAFLLLFLVPLFGGIAPPVGVDGLHLLRRREAAEGLRGGRAEGAPDPGIG
jgi:hypothetical protein